MTFITIFSLAVIIILSFAVILGKNWYILKKIAEPVAVLDLQCNPEMYIKMNKDILNKKIIKNRIEYFFVTLNISVGYFSNGNIEKAISTAKNIPLDKLEKNFSFKIAYYYNLSTFYAMEGNRTMVKYYNTYLQECYENFESASKNKNTQTKNFYIGDKNRILNQLKKLTEEVSIHINRLDGEYQKVIDYYEKKLQQKNPLCSNCFSRYYQALCYEKLGDIPAMKEALMYVAEHGNKLYIAIEGRKTLNKYN